MGKRGRPNRTGIDWSDPHAVAAYKRSNEQHHEYNREYHRERHAPHLLGEPKTTPAGERNPNARLQASDIPLIRQLDLAGYTHQEIADAIEQVTCRRVTKTAVGDVLRGRTWRHTEE